MVAAAHVEPFHIGEDVPKSLRNRRQGGLQGVGVLLAEGMEVQSVQQGGQLRGHLPVPLGPGGPQPGAGGAGVVDRVALLGGALGIDPQTDALSGGLGPGAEFCQLAGGIEDDVARVLQQLFKLVRPVGPAEDVDLLFRQLLKAQPRLKQTAGLGAR